MSFAAAIENMRTHLPATRRARRSNRSNRARPRERGQELVEFAIVIVLFMAIALGAVTFSHAFLVSNMITHAIRDGARISSTWPNRIGGCGLFDRSTEQPIIDNVTNKIATVVGQAAANKFHIDISQNPTPNAATPCANPPPQTPTIDVHVTGCVPYIFPIVPHPLGYDCGNGELGFNVDRSVAFHDERIPNG